MKTRGLPRWLARFAVGAILFGAAAPRPAAAAGIPVASEPAIDVLWHTGVVGLFDHEARDTFASVEARLRANWHELRPWAGLTIVDSGAWFSGAGLVYDIKVSEHGRLTFGSGPFYYSNGKHRDEDLGLDLEFYSFAEMTWAWKGDTRLGLRLGHLSNAGLGRRNPGTETLSLILSVPLERRAVASSDR